MTPEEMNAEADLLFEQADLLEQECNKIKLQLQLTHANADRDAGRDYDREWAAKANFALRMKTAQYHTDRRNGSAIRKKAKTLTEKRRQGDIDERRAIRLNAIKEAIATGRQVFQVKNEENLWRDVNQRDYQVFLETGHTVRIAYVTVDNDDHKVQI